MPDHKKIRNHKQLKIFGSLLHGSNLWHFNRHSVSGAFGVGFFMAWVPVPFQMILATATAIYFRVNLPVSVGLVWITNPLTIPPLFWFAYWVGSTVLGTAPTNIPFSLSYHWLETILPIIWKPFLLGCLINGVISSAGGFYGIRYLWIRHVWRQWNGRYDK